MPKKLYLAERLVQKVAILNTVASLTVNSVMDIFLKVLQNFQNHLQEHILSIIKSEHMLSETTSSIENCMYLKLIYFLYHS